MISNCVGLILGLNLKLNFIFSPPHIVIYVYNTTIDEIYTKKYECWHYKKEIFKAFPKLKRSKFWGSGLWNKGYYVGTAGTVSSEIIVKYI
ncbi:transposase [Clostridium botulinum]|uniref:transposase n=1 Tax=Clostridium botulinum TaxID=1491 RepID=UPI0028FC2B0B|nr:transposase [Clostridium botulinum]